MKLKSKQRKNSQFALLTYRNYSMYANVWNLTFSLNHKKCERRSEQTKNAEVKKTSTRTRFKIKRKGGEKWNQQVITKQEKKGSKLLLECIKNKTFKILLKTFRIWKVLIEKVVFILFWNFSAQKFFRDFPRN